MQRGVRVRRARQRHLRDVVLPRRRHPPRGGCLHLRGRNRAFRKPRRKARFAAHQTAELSGRDRRLYGEPTVVNNVETVSSLPWIVVNGGAAFAHARRGFLGGHAGFALSGHVEHPGWYEIEMSKTTFAISSTTQPLAAASGRPRVEGLHPGRRLGAVVGPDHVDLGLDQDAVGKAGSMLGSGSVVVIDDTTCVVRAAWRMAPLPPRVLRPMHAVS